MRNLWRRSTRRSPATLPYVFCETGYATPFSRQHIRPVGQEGRKPGGGLFTDALCGTALEGGWDLSMPVTADTVYTLSTPRPGDARVFLCPACAQAFVAATGVRLPTPETP